MNLTLNEAEPPLELQMKFGCRNLTGVPPRTDVLYGFDLLSNAVMVPDVIELNVTIASTTCPSIVITFLYNHVSPAVLADPAMRRSPEGLRSLTLKSRGCPATSMNRERLHGHVLN
ncbi:hypothetical protein [Cyanobium sp. ULC065]